MKLDCIEGSSNKGEDSAWIIIDYDNDCKEFVSGTSVEHAWFMAARRLELRVNDARLILNA